MNELTCPSGGTDAGRILHDIATGDAFSGPRRLEAAGHRYSYLFEVSHNRAIFALVGIPSPINGPPNGPEEAPQQVCAPRHRWGFFFFKHYKEKP